jgi:transcriptional regulator with XRE-family HTH domain
MRTAMSDLRHPPRHRGPSSPRPLQASRAGASDDPDSPIDRRLPDEDARLRAIVGARLREARAARGVSVRRLATECGLTSGFLSQVENGHVMPSVASLVRICAALGIHVADVFGGLGQDAGTVRLIRPGGRKAYAYPGTGIVDEILGADSGGRVEVLRSIIAPGGSTGQQLYVHQAEVEVVFVLTGELTVSFADCEYRLTAGDSLTFPGPLPHQVRNVGDEESESIWVLAPATY